MTLPVPVPPSEPAPRTPAQPAPVPAAPLPTRPSEPSAVPVPASTAPPIPQPVPVAPPAPGAASAPAPVLRSARTGETYTHRTWMDEMADALCLVARVCDSMSVMESTLEQVGAGRTQMQLVGDARASSVATMQRALHFVTNTDERYQLVAAAIQRAGGLTEVARDKHYHDQS